MKKIIFILTISLLLFSCSSEKKEDKKNVKDQTKIEESQSSDTQNTSISAEDNESTNTVQNSSELYTLTYKFPKNKELKYLVTQTSDTKVNAETKDSTNTVSKKRVLTNNVKVVMVDVNKDKSYDLDITVEDFNLDFNVNGETKNYSSQNIPAKRKDKRNIDYHIALLNNKFSVTLSNKGKILLIAETDDIVEELLRINSKGQTIEAVDKAPYSERLIDNVLLPFTKNIFKKLPINPVTPDSVWHERFSQRIGQFILDNSFDFQIAGILDDNVVKIKIGVTSKIIKEIDQFADSTQVFTMKPQFKGNGSIYFDYEKGIVKNIHLETTHEYEFKDLGAEAKPLVHYLIKDILDVKLK